jgi:hypothetical protein
VTINAKATIFFQSEDEEGWSEGFYISSTDLAAAAGTLASIIPLRAAMMDPHFSMIYSRVSDVEVKGDSLVAPSITFPVVGTLTDAGDQLEANTALNVEIFASPSVKNRIFIRGLNIAVIRGREYLAPAGFSAAFEAWDLYLTGNGLMCRHRTAVGPPPTYDYVAATGISPIGATARKPGRPFGLPVGRRRVP